MEGVPGGEAEPGLEASSLTVRDSRGATRLDDISFSLPGRSLLSAVGPSGAGKSTLLGALSGMRPAQTGHVCFGGRDLYAQYRALRHQVGYVLQEDVVHPQLTVVSALGYAAELRFDPGVLPVERRRRVEEVIEELGLTDSARRRIRTLSGGQRRRVNIGVELLTRPRLLFLDEPTSGLDPGMERQVMHLLRDLADGGRTVVLVTHSVLCLDVCDQVMFVAPGGRMAYIGPPAEALSYFGCADYAEVFSRLDERRDVDWKGAFRASPAYRSHVEQPMATAAADGLPATPAPVPRTQGPLHQLRTLVHRYLAVLGSDRLNLALLVLQAPVLGVIVAQAVASGGFVQSSKDAYPAASQALLFLVVSTTYLGAGNAVREIVKELPIYLRERATGLSIGSYLGSKVLVLAVVTAIQAALLVAVGAYRQGGPGQGAVMPLRLELVIDLAAAGVVSMGAGLLISALVSRADKALTLLPLLLVPQLVLTVPGLRIEQKPVLNQLSLTASARWGYDALGSSVHLNQLLYENEASADPLLPAQDALWEVADVDHASPAQWRDIAAAGTEPEARWRRQRAAWAGDLAALAAIFLIELAATAWALSRRDPAFVSSRARLRSP